MLKDEVKKIFKYVIQQNEEKTQNQNNSKKGNSMFTRLSQRFRLNMLESFYGNPLENSLQKVAWNKEILMRMAEVEDKFNQEIGADGRDLKAELGKN